MKTSDLLLYGLIGFGVYELILKPKTVTPGPVAYLPGSTTPVSYNPNPSPNLVSSGVSVAVAAVPELIDLIKNGLGASGSSGSTPLQSVMPTPSFDVNPVDTTIPSNSTLMADVMSNNMLKDHLISGIIDEETCR